MATLAVEGLTKRFGETVAVSDLSFSVEAGEIFGFLGPNGAGKTTTIRAMLGFLSPTEGTATVLGHDVRDERELVRAKAEVGYLPSAPAFDGSITGREFLDFQGALKGASRRDELLALFTPPLDRKIREYSSGNRQMLGIVQAFMHDPELVILDEPTSGLDPLKQEAFNRFLRDERGRGVTVFLSSHVLAEVRRVCDRVGIIREGELVALEDVETLLRRGGKHVRVNTETPIDRNDFDLPGVVEWSQEDRQVGFTFTGDYNDLLSHLGSYRIVDLEVEEPPIEDVFMHYYNEESEISQSFDERDAAPPTDEGLTDARDTANRDSEPTNHDSEPTNRDSEPTEDRR